MTSLLLTIIGVLLLVVAYQTVRVWWWRSLHSEIGRRWWKSLDVLCSEQADSIRFERAGRTYQRELGRIYEVDSEWPEEIDA